MIIITSGAFISSELQVELGRLPPALLPLGNKRLYEHQVAALREAFPDVDIFLTLTDAYDLRSTDELLLQRLNVKLIYVPDGLPLGYSLLHVINTIGHYDESIRVLHGDTLLSDVPRDLDIVAIAQAEDEYPWEVESDTRHAEMVWCGYFAFSDIKLLARSMSAARGRFVEGVRLYQASHGLIFPTVTGWLDMGHVNTYFRSRAKMTTQRAFNELIISNGTVFKSSAQASKMIAEACWFGNLPPSVKRYAPQLIRSGENDGRNFYEVEYLPYLPLNELYVHGSLPKLFWEKIFRLTDAVLSDLRGASALTSADCEKVQADFSMLVVEKTDQRLDEYAIATGCDMERATSFNGVALPSLRTVAATCQEAARALPAMPGVSHGDFCFSNILFDSRANSLKVIDPRGLNAAGELTIIGDLKYDIAKFAHSLVGLYDHIVAGLFTLIEPEPLHFTLEIHVDRNIANIQESFGGISLLGFSPRDVLPLVILLFLSMLPLHHDKPDRQRAFLANALRLYVLWKEES